MKKTIYRMMVVLALVVPGILRASFEGSVGVDKEAADIFAKICFDLEHCYNIKNTEGTNDRYNAKIESIKDHIDELASIEESLLKVLVEDESQSTLLTMAARYNCFEVAKYLLDNFDITRHDHLNKFNLTAFDYVRTADMPVHDKMCGTFCKVQDGMVISIKGKPLIHQNRKFAQYLQAKMEEQRKAKLMQDLQSQDKQDLAYKVFAGAQKDQKEGAQAQFAAVVEAPPAQQPKMLSALECGELVEKFKKYVEEVFSLRAIELYEDAASRNDEEVRKVLGNHLDSHFASYIKTEVEFLAERTDVSVLQKRLEDAYKEAGHTACNLVQRYIQKKKEEERARKLEVEEATKKEIKSDKKKERRRAKAIAEQSGAMRDAVQAMTMWDVHQDPYWHARYRGDANALLARNADCGLTSYNHNEYVKWWKDHQAKNKDCAACKNHAQSMKNRKNKPQRRNSF